MKGRLGTHGCVRGSRKLANVTTPMVGLHHNRVGGMERLTPEKRQQIEHLLAQSLSLRAIQRQVFGYIGGKAYRTVKRVQQESATSSGVSAFERRPITA